MTIPITINQYRTNAVIDTGSQVTISSQELCEAAGMQLMEHHTIAIHGVGDNMGMSAGIALNVPLAVGNAIYQWTVLVGAIRENFILGLDFLYEVGAQLDFRRGYLQIADAIITASYMTDLQGHGVAIAPVIVNEKTAIPAVCSQSIECHLPERFGAGTPILLEPIPSKHPIFLSPGVNGSGPHINVEVVNLAERSIKIPVGTVIATARQVEVEDTADVESQPSTNKGETSAGDTLTPTDTPELPSHLVDLYLRSIANLEGEECVVLQKLLSDYGDVFASHDFDLGEFSTIMHRIDTGDSPPVRHGLRRTPLGFQGEEEAHLNLMVENGIIQPSASEWAAAPVIVKKKDGKYRYCIDYRDLNQATRRDSYPLPLIEECLDALAENRYFSTLDMASGYWQVVIDPRDRYKTAFITKYGLFEHVRLAMGLCNSPATYQRIMTYVLQNMLWKNVLVYLDDIIILGRTFDEHRRALGEVLQRFREHNLKFKPKKCELFRTEVDFLGRRVGRDGITIPEAKIKSVLEWPVPTTKTELESFLGFINYHREFIPALAEKANVLYQLVKATPKGQHLCWSGEHQQSFEDLIGCMVTAPVLAYPDPTGIFILDVDASDSAIGAELSQLQDGQERVVAYASQSLAAPQRRYCTTRKELLALVTFMNQFRFYLLGRHFVVRTDHNSLIWLMRFKNIEGQLARWLESLSQFDFRIEHRPGRLHGNADGLSRIPQEECPYYEVGTTAEMLPCGGCKYCTRMQNQWERFSDFVDDILPLSVRQVTLDPAVGDPIPEDTPSASDDWASQQREDPELNVIIQWLEEEEDPDPGILYLQSSAVKHLWRLKEQLALRQGILCYKWVCPSGTVTRSLIIVPSQRRQEIIAAAHANVCSGHPGPEKTVHFIRHRFFWVGMKEDVKVYIQSCDLCSRNKKASRNPRSPMKKFHAGEPMERIHIDILGPLTETDRHNKYVLVMVDQFTKWVELEALPEQSAERVARAFVERFVCRMGCANQVFSDQGKNFDSKLFHEMCELLQTAKVRTTPYRPSSNGQVERMNREILNKLRVHIDGRQAVWDLYLPFVGMAMRATVNRSTGFTPNMMMLGREVNLPMDFLATVPNEEEAFLDEAEYVQQLRLSLQEIRNCAREKLGDTLHSRKRTYDRKLHVDTYDVGDLVYLLNSAGKVGQSRKLQPVYTGPHLIVKKLSDILFTTVNSRGRQQVIHHDRMRRCSDLNIPIWARRERNKLAEVNVPEDPIEVTDWALPQLFQEERDTQPDLQRGSRPAEEQDNAETEEGNTEAEDPPLVTDPPVVDLPTPPSGSDQPVPDPDPRLPPSKRSGRRRRQPAWLRDYISQRGVVPAHH